MSMETDQKAALLLEDGTLINGYGLGLQNVVVGEICFNTAMTGYQETLTDPSYSGQIITFTNPHIGNVGTNDEDHEQQTAHANGFVIRETFITTSNWRAKQDLDSWARSQNLVGISGVDTRRVAGLIRDKGAMKAALINPATQENIQKAHQELDEFPGLEGLDLASKVSTAQKYEWDEGLWATADVPKTGKTVVAIDYGMKTNILRHLRALGCRVIVCPANISPSELEILNPDGVFLSNGPGDPSATAHVAMDAINWSLDKKLPLFGICLGHQLLALALGAQTKKMKFGHHGVNHPVKEIQTGKVAITSMNHGFTVDASSFPQHVKETHVSLFDGTNCGLEAFDGRVFSVQYHPEASPGPHDTTILFQKFIDALN